MFFMMIQLVWSFICSSWTIVNYFDHTETVARRCSVKKVFLKIKQNSYSVKTQACNFIKKETPTDSFEFCRIFKNTFFIEHLQWLLLDYGLFWGDTGGITKLLDSV